jgi:4-amino-4-deoxy-L-arabinose transferase-like glycosyltransferase
VLWGVLVALVFAFTCAVWGLTEGVVAALLVMLLPRGVFHAGLACFDAPITTLWFATVVAYWQSLRKPRWSWTVGVAFGLALATKHNAIILPFVILAHHAWLCVRARTWKVQPWAPAALLLGPVVLYVLWPWLWHAPVAHARDWIGFHLHHTHYNFEYLGENWNHPAFPWHVAIVTTLFTVPVITIAAGLVGTGVLVARARRREAQPHAPGMLIALSLAASMGPFFLGSTPIFGAEKHWMPAIPSVCIAAAIGLVWAARRASAAWPRVPAPASIVAVASLAVLASASELRQSHPYALSSYNALAGGAPGGADLGMNRQFWGVAARGVIPWLRTQPPGPVYSHDASPAWGLYQKWGLLPKGYRDSGREEAGIAKSTYAFVVHELHFNRHDYLIWDSYGTVQPSYVLLADGVPIVTVYSRP